MKVGFTSVGAVLGLAAAGFGGYNLITTGCPLGTCAAPAAITTASTSTDSHECALGCSEHAPTPVDVVSVATKDEKASTCCAGDAAAKADKLAKGESCCGSCTEKAGCEGKSEGACEEGKGETCPITGQTSADEDHPVKTDPKQPA
jgi:hypothetical protein